MFGKTSLFGTKTSLFGNYKVPVRITREVYVEHYFDIMDMNVAGMTLKEGDIIEAEYSKNSELMSVKFGKEWYAVHRITSSLLDLTCSMEIIPDPVSK